MAMIAELNRRELLERLLVIPPISHASCRQGDLFDRERVCAHVYQPRRFLPPPLVRDVDGQPPRQGAGLFTVGLAEIVLCSTQRSFIDVFQYFWPLSREEFKSFQTGIVVHSAIDAGSDAAVVSRLQDHIRKAKAAKSDPARLLAVVLTWNRRTQHWASAISGTCRMEGIDELVVFKDPTVLPYLCDHRSLQKGFKRPPP